MKKLIKNQGSNWLPDFYSETAAGIDFKYLTSQGVKACFFDLDHTILQQQTNVFDRDMLAALKAIKLDIFVATNRKYSPELDDIAKQMGAKGVVHRLSIRDSKPSKSYYRRVVKAAGVKPNQIVMVGDRLVQDVWGAQRSGLKSVMVGKFGKMKWTAHLNSVQDHLIPILFKDSYEDIN